MKLKHEKLKDMTALCVMSDTIVVTAHNDGTMCIWDTSRDDPLVKTWIAHSVEPYYRTAHIGHLIKIDDKTVASGGHDCHIRLWDIPSGNCVKDLGDSGYISGLQLRTNGQLVSSSIYNSDRSRTVRLWDYNTGACLSTFIPDGKVLGVNAGAHWRYPTNMVVLPNQNVAFSTYNEAHGGRAIVVLDPVKQTYECYPVEHSQPISGLTVIPTSYYDYSLATVSTDLTLKKWPSSISPSMANCTYNIAHYGTLRALDDGILVCIGADKVSIYNTSGQRLTTIDVKAAYFIDAKSCDDIFIKLTDYCIFKINIREFLAFIAQRGENVDIHYYLLTRNDASLVKAFIELGMRKLTDVIGANGNTLMHEIIRNGNADILEIFLQRADMNDINAALVKPNCTGETPYQLAHNLQHTNIVRRLQSYPAIENIELKKTISEHERAAQQDRQQITTLHAECERLRAEMRQASEELSQARDAHQRLSNELRDSQATNKSLVYALNEQLQRKDAELQEEKQRRQDTELENLLIVAAREGNLINVDNLLRLNGNLKINVNARNSEGHTPLLQAAFSGNKSVVKLLIEKQADLYAVDASGCSILDHLAKNAKVEMLEFFIGEMPPLELFPHLVLAWHACQPMAPAELYQPVHRILSNNMLRCAVKQANLLNVKLALDVYCADIDFQDHYNETALHKACYYSHAEIVEFLLAAGARMDIEDRHHQKAGEVIGTSEQKDAILTLFKFYALLHLVESGKPDPIRQYVLGHPELLLGNLAPAKQEKLFTVALNLPPSSDRIEIIRMLFADGQMKKSERNLTLQRIYFGNDRGKNDTMPLHMAVSKNDHAIVKLLLKLGASKDDKANGKTAVQYARELGHTELADYILAKFAKEKYKRKHGSVSTASCTMFANGDAASAAAQVASVAAAQTASDTGAEIKPSITPGIHP